MFNPVILGKLKVHGAGEKLHKLATSVGARNTDELYRNFGPQWQNPEQISTQGKEWPSLLDDDQACPKNLDFVEKMIYLDQLTYLPSDILCKVDRAFMSVGLEARVPFLDNNVARFAWSLPVSTKLHNGISKWPLRQVLKRYVPEDLFERPKMGFGIPVGDWLRRPLRDWAEDLLSEPSLADGGYFDIKRVRETWRAHLSGHRNHTPQLCLVLIFLAWKRKWIDRR